MDTLKYTITKTNHKGLMEWFTPVGFRSAKSIKEQNLEKNYYNKTDGTAKVLELKKDCRTSAMKKSIILNYS